MRSRFVPALVAGLAMLAEAGTFAFVRLLTEQEAAIRSLFVPALVAGLVTLPACHSSSGFTDGMQAVAQATTALETCFREKLPPAEPHEKGRVLEPCVEAAEKQILKRLESLKPPSEQAACYVDSLDGARRAVGSMKDMLVLYRDTTDPVFGALIVNFARTADDGLEALDKGLRACRARPIR